MNVILYVRRPVTNDVLTTSVPNDVLRTVHLVPNHASGSVLICAVQFYVDLSVHVCHVMNRVAPFFSVVISALQYVVNHAFNRSALNVFLTKTKWTS